MKRVVDLRSLCQLYHDASADSAALTGVWYACSGFGNPANIFRCDTSENIYKFLGAIPAASWEEALARPEQTCGSLGVADDLNTLIKSDPYLRAKANRPLPDLFIHPTEDLALGITPDLAVRIVQSNQDMVKVPIAGAFNWVPETQFSLHFQVPYQQVSQVEGKFQINMSRDQYEQNFSDLKFYLGSEPHWTIKIGLDGGAYLEAHIAGSVSKEEGPITYSDLPQSFRDETWKKAVENGIQNYKARNGGTATTIVSVPIKTVDKP